MKFSHLIGVAAVALMTTAVASQSVPAPASSAAPAAPASVAPASPATAGSAAPANVEGALQADVAAGATSASAPELPAHPGDVAAGQTKAGACAACHGIDGNSADPQYPRLGTDYEVLSVPQPTWNAADGKVEVVEVFSYMCHVCAEVQPTVDQYKPHLPADARWSYVPAAFGGPWDQAARAYFASEAMGIADSTHSRVFPAIFVQQKIQKGTAEEFADLYASFGADRARFLDTMSSFGVTAKFNRAKQFALRTGVTGTPTIIVNGKYRVTNTRDRGIRGMLATVDYLIARERAGAPAAAAPTP